MEKINWRRVLVTMLYLLAIACIGIGIVINLWFILVGIVILIIFFGLWVWLE